MDCQNDSVQMVLLRNSLESVVLVRHVEFAVQPAQSE